MMDADDATLMAADVEVGIDVAAGVVHAATPTASTSAAAITKAAAAAAAGDGHSGR